MSEVLAMLAKAREKQASKPPVEISFTMDDFAGVQKGKSDHSELGEICLEMQDFSPPEPVPEIPGAVKRPVETVARITVTRMLKSCGMNEPFEFFVYKLRGEAYVNNMRVLISRLRNRLRASRTKFVEFKLIQVSIKQEGEYDRVIVMRTRPGIGARNVTVYQELENMLGDLK